MQYYFVLNERGEPVLERDVEVWSSWFHKVDRGVRRTTISRAPGIYILTELRGVGLLGSDGQPKQLYKTRVYGGILEGEEILTDTREQAIAMHEQIVLLCRQGNQENLGITDEQITISKESP